MIFYNCFTEMWSTGSLCAFNSIFQLLSEFKPSRVRNWLECTGHCGLWPLPTTLTGLYTYRNVFVKRYRGFADLFPWVSWVHKKVTLRSPQCHVFQLKGNCFMLYINTLRASETGVIEEIYQRLKEFAKYFYKDIYWIDSEGNFLVLHFNFEA